jgi:hypothetical protein
MSVLSATEWIAIEPDAIVSARPYSSITARPGLASPGQLVTISGNAPRHACAGEWVTLKSYAFSSRFTTDGIPSIRAQILGDGTYHVAAKLLSGLAPTSYTVLGTYNREPLDTTARITIG